jgi:hypothetical protein
MICCIWQEKNVWRHQRGNQKLQIEGHTIQWLKKEGQTMRYKTQYRKLKIEQLTRTPLQIYL